MTFTISGHDVAIGLGICGILGVGVLLGVALLAARVRLWR